MPKNCCGSQGCITITKLGRKKLLGHEVDDQHYGYSAYVPTSDLSDGLLWVAFKHSTGSGEPFKDLKNDDIMQGQLLWQSEKLILAIPGAKHDYINVFLLKTKDLSPIRELTTV